MTNAPSPNGRDGRGRFAPGWKGGPGNPHAAQVARLRAEMLDAVTPDDMRAIVSRLVELARGSDVRAIKEVLDRTLGRPQEPDFIERLEALEALIVERTQ